MISAEHLDRLMYKECINREGEIGKTMDKPKFFVAQEDISTKTEFFPAGSEAERRITFFAQSLYVLIIEARKS